MARTQTMVQLTDELNRRLDREAERRGCSRSAIIRLAVAEHLERTSIDEDITAYVEAYRRTPQGDVDHWGVLDAQTGGHSDGFSALLDAQDAADGFSWPPPSPSNCPSPASAPTMPDAS